jgi:hypothetical protein
VIASKVLSSFSLQEASPRRPAADARASIRRWRRGSDKWTGRSGMPAPPKATPADTMGAPMPWAGTSVPRAYASRAMGTGLVQGQSTRKKHWTRGSAPSEDLWGAGLLPAGDCRAQAGRARAGRSGLVPASTGPLGQLWLRPAGDRGATLNVQGIAAAAARVSWWILGGAFRRLKWVGALRAHQPIT